MSAKNSYKMFVHSLELIDDNQPFDFRLTIQNIKNGSKINGPIIKAIDFQCEQQFPWQFIGIQDHIRIYFVQFTESKRIQKGWHQLKLKPNQKQQSLLICAQRTNKQICQINFTVELESSRQNPQNINEGICQKKQEDNLEQQNKTQRKADSNNKEQIKQIVKQIESLKNKMNELQKKKQAYNKQNDSNFDQNQEKCTPQYRQVQNCNDSQRLQQPSSRLQWYKSKYGKQMPLNLSSQFEDSNKSINQNVSISIQYSDNLSLIHDAVFISEILYSGQIQPQQIMIYKNSGHDQKPIITLSSSQPTKVWNKSFLLPFQSIFYFIVQADNNTKMYSCIDMKYQNKQSIYLFNQEGDPATIMKIKWKFLQSNQAQTIEILNTIVQNQVEQQNNQKQPQQVIPQTQQKNQCNHVQTQTPRLVQIQQQQPHFPLTYQSIKQIRIPGKIRSFRKQNNFGQLSQNQQFISQRSPQHSYVQQYQNHQRHYQYQQIKMTKTKFDQNITRKTANRASRLEIKDNVDQQKMKIRHISHSYSLFFAPSLRASSVHSQKHRNSFIITQNDQSTNKVTQSDFGRINVGIKIQSVSLKLSQNNKNELSGKFIKLQINNKQPFITETLCLSSNLIWKGKGYIFDKVPIFSELVISVYSQKQQCSQLMGSARICLALLNLDRNDKVVFYHDFVRNQEMKQIGQLILGYESLNTFQKYAHPKKVLTQPNLSNHKSKSKRKLKKDTKSKISCPINNKKKNNNAGIGMGYSDIKSIQGSASKIRSKKYTGGNIVIGRSSRFNYDTNKIQKDAPGPGNYQYSSMFHKYQK